MGGVAYFGDGVQQPGRLHQRPCLATGVVARCFDPPGHRCMTILGVGRRAFGDTDRLRLQGVDESPGFVELAHRSLQVARPQLFEVVKFGNRDRTHVLRLCFTPVGTRSCVGAR